MNEEEGHYTTGRSWEKGPEAGVVIRVAHRRSQQAGAGSSTQCGMSWMIEQ